MRIKVIGVDPNGDTYTLETVDVERANRRYDLLIADGCSVTMTVTTGEPNGDECKRSNRGAAPGEGESAPGSGLRASLEFIRREVLADS